MAGLVIKLLAKTAVLPLLEVLLAIQAVMLFLLHFASWINKIFAFCRYRCHNLPGGRDAGNCGLAGSPADGRDKFLLLPHPICGRVANGLTHKCQPWLT